MKIVADENIPFADSLFAAFGDVVRVSGRDLQASQVADADMLIVRSVTLVNRALLDGSRVRFVGTCTIGTDHVDLDYLAQQGIGFSNAPGCNAVSVVEYILSCLTHLWHEQGVEFLTKRVGIIGLGNVGGRLYRRLTAMGMDCVGYDPLIDQQSFVNMADLDTVLRCDIICLHTPLTTDGDYPTRHLLSLPQLKQLKPGAVLINAGRGGAINNADLLSLLRAGQDLNVVLDVFESEPNIDLSLLPFLQIATPHIAGYSFDGKVTGTQMIFAAACAFFKRGELLANPAKIESASLDAPVLAALQQADLYSAMYQLVQSVYSVKADDQRTREKLLAARSDEVGIAFDELRKHYPRRRQWLDLTLPAPSRLDEAQSKVFAGLGVVLTD